MSHIFDNSKIFSWNWDAQRVLRIHSGAELTLAIQALEHEAGMASMETEDLLQQMELHQLQSALEQNDHKQQELDGKTSNPWEFVHWIGIIISAVVTFVIVTIFAGCF